jgi:hypothetical protein
MAQNVENVVIIEMKLQPEAVSRSPTGEEPPTSLNRAGRRFFRVWPYGLASLERLSESA